MIYSGADLIRTSGQQQERMSHLELVAPVAKSEDSSTATLDQNTHNALTRLASFIKQELHKDGGDQPETPAESMHSAGESPNIGIHDAYVVQIETLYAYPQKGRIISIYA